MPVLIVVEWLSPECGLEPGEPGEPEEPGEQGRLTEMLLRPGGGAATLILPEVVGRREKLL